MPDEVIIVDGSGTEHHFPAGFDPKKAGEIVRQRTASAAPAESKGDLGRYAGYKRIGDAIINHPVATGAAVGSMVAAPFTGGASLLAAGLGGAGGAGIGEIVDQVRNGPKSTGDVARSMLTEGAFSLAGEGIGRGVMAGATKLGKLAYKAALRPSMGAQREFGDIAATGLREAAPVSQAGAEGVERSLGESGKKANQMIADAQAAGAAPVTTREVAGEFGDVFRQGRNQAQLGRPDPRPGVWQRLKAFDAKNPAGIPLDRAQTLKGEAQDLASKAYRAQDLGHPLTDLSAASDKAMASGLRKGIEARVPGIDNVNQHSQELIGLVRALEDASRRNVPGVGSLRSLLGDFVPSVSSRAGIGLDRVGRSSLTPASFRTALIAAMSGQE